MSGKKNLEDRFEASLKIASLVTPIPSWEREYRFSKKRKFRFDFAWPEFRFAVEIQGGVWIDGAHSRGSGLNKDYEKNFWALALGWRVLYICVNQIEGGIAIEWTTTMLNRLIASSKKEPTENVARATEKIIEQNIENEIHLPDYGKKGAIT